MEEPKPPEQSSEISQNQTAPPQVPTQPRPFLKFNRTILIGLIAVTLLAIAAFASYFVLSSNQKRVAPPLTTATPTPASIADWKTYNNREYGFSFRYPPNFTLTESKEVNDLTDHDGNKVTAVYNNYSFSTGLMIKNGNKEEPDWSGFGIIVIPTNGKTILEEYDNKNPQSVYGPTKVKILPTYGNADEVAEVENTQIAKLFRKDGNFYSFAHFQDALTLPDGSDSITPYFEQILSTFKFTN